LPILVDDIGSKGDQATAGDRPRVVCAEQPAL
jgi:hypothetical protein